LSLPDPEEIPKGERVSQSSPDPRRWWALFLLCAAQFVVIMDTSIIGVALPAMQEALDISQANLQWVFNAYVVAFGGLLLLGGRLADLFGQRRLFALGFAVLTLSSLVAGLAQSDAVLFAGRALMGVGAALAAPAALSLIIGLFAAQPNELGKALSFYGAAAPAGGTAGGFLGGVLTELLDWRWTLLVNVPLGLIILVFSPLLLPAGTARRGRVDVVGALAVTGGLALAVYAVVTANDVGWGSARTVGLLAGATVLLAVFVLVQRALRDSLVPLRIFRAPNLSAGNAAMALLGAAWIPMWFFLNLYLQQVLGYGALQSGLALVPMTVLIMVLMVGAASRIIGRFGFKWPLVVGLLVLAGGVALFGRLPADGTFAADVLPISLLAATGMSLAYIPALIAATSGARPEEAGLASGLVNTSYQFGSALGLAVATAISASFAAGRLAGGAGDLVALNDGFRAAFVGAAIIAAAGAVLALVAIRMPRPVPEAPQQPVPEATAEGEGASALVSGPGETSADGAPAAAPRAAGTGGRRGPVVVGYDGSGSARRAIEEAGVLFGGSRAVVLYAWEAVELAALRRGAIGMSATASEGEVDAKAGTEAARVAAEGAELARRHGLEAEARAVPAVPSVWETIVRVADEEGASAIVLGSRGLRGLRSLTLGSVSNQVAQHAHQPVLAIPSPELVDARRELSTGAASGRAS
jgi:EmrB/QacA subfamily drug resistance transporter